jgi:hypothetical protein
MAILSGCNGLFLDTYWQSGQYRLIAVDVKGQMNLAVDLGNGGSIGIVGPTVFSLGANDQYIVAMQHPATNESGDFDRRVTNYFVVTRLPFDPKDQERGVQGPLNKEQFDQLSTSLHLPAFTKTFDDLK